QTCALPILFDAVESERRRIVLLPVEYHTLDPADERPPFLTLEVVKIGGILDRLDLVVADPAKVLVVQVVVADAVERAAGQPVADLEFLTLLRRQPLQQLVARLVVALARGLAGDLVAAGESDDGDGLGPERAHAVPDDHQQKSADQDDAQRQCATEAPKGRFADRRQVGGIAPHGLALLFLVHLCGLDIDSCTHVPSGAQSWKARLRKRWRMTSATVLMTKVITNSVSAARNSMRYRVPPTTASGNSTAMVADSVRR